MLKKILFSSIIIFCFIKFTTAQDKKEIKRLKLISIEVGTDLLDSDIPSYDFIRGDISYWGAGTSSNHLSGFFEKYYFGLKAEIRNKNNRFGLLGGLRFSSINSSLGKNSYWETSSDYFYLLLNQESTSTEFVRINEINYNSNYIGVPLELRFFPANPRVVRFYIKIGAEFSYLLNTSSEAKFDNISMNNYESEVLAKFSDPDDFYALLYGGAGINFFIKEKISINFEATVPSGFISGYSTGLINPSAGGGFQLNIQIPF